MKVIRSSAPHRRGSVFAPVLVLAALLLGLVGGPAESATSFSPGDLFVGVVGGKVLWYQRSNLTGSPQILDTGFTKFTTGMAFDASGYLYVTVWDSNSIIKFDTQGNRIGAFGSKYRCWPESIVFDTAGNAYVGQAACASILKLGPAGNFLESFRVAAEDRGADWIDLTTEQCTMFYTSEGKHVKRFDLSTNTQLSDFNSVALPGSKAFAIALLPDGGLLAADSEVIVRLGNGGNTIQTYDAVGQDHWFALSLDPTDSTVFWAADEATGTVFKFPIMDPSVWPGPFAPDFQIVTGSFINGLAVFPDLKNNPPVPKGRGCLTSPPPPPIQSPGRMTGGGSIFTSGGVRVTHGFELHCDITRGPNNLEVNWGSGNKFSLEVLTKASCTYDDTISPKPPAAGFNTYTGEGTGRLNGVPGYTATWTFTDAGEPGNNDFAQIEIKVGGTIHLSASGNLNKGDQQAHK